MYRRLHPVKRGIDHQIVPTKKTKKRRWLERLSQEVQAELAGQSAVRLESEVRIIRFNACGGHAAPVLACA